MVLLAIDWNGTIIDDTAGWAKAYNAALNVLGIQEQTLEELQHHYDTPVIKSILNFGVSQDDYNKHAKDLFRAFAETLAIHTAESPLRKGAVEFLNHRKQAGDTLFLLSNHHQDQLKIELTRCGLTNVFDNVSGRNCDSQIITKTTKQGRLLAFMDETGHIANDVVIIGDAREEARIGNNIKATSICITGGYSSRKQLLAEGAHHVVDSLTEIKTILVQMYDVK
jgi:phosphoglycolate phosphatase-like HAD superfamily hydrolase